MLTGDASWAERDLARLDSEGIAALDDGDLPGSGAGDDRGHARAGAGAADGEAKPRAAASSSGDTDFASNELLDAFRNRDLFLNAVNWLIGDVEAIAVRPNSSRASRFQLSAEEFRAIRSASLFVLPEAIAVLGVFTWWSRRNPAEARR